MTASDTKPVYFTPTVTPSNTTEKGVWSTDDPDVVTVDAKTGAITISPDLDLSQHGGGIATAVVKYTVGDVSDSGVVVVFPAGYDLASVTSEAVMMILSE